MIMPKKGKYDEGEIDGSEWSEGGGDGGKEEVHLDSKCGMALSWGPYLAALSYSSNNGMARSFIFLGTARTLRSGI